MNKIYKVIYSKAKNCYIVASEIAKSSTKSASGSKKKAAALLCAAVLSGGLSVSAADLNVTYDDDKKAKITLGTDGSTVDILGVAGGKVYEGSTHVASGDDVWQIDQRITGFSASLDSINTGMSKINASLASNLKDITTLQTTTATIKQKVERGYNFQINGIDAKVATPNDNDVNFTNGDHVTITNQNGALKFSVNDNGKVAAGDTQFVTGDTVNTAITAEATVRQTEDDNIKNNIIGTTTDGSYVKAANTVAGNLGALDTQVKSNTDAIAKEVKDRADEITKAKEELNTKISTLDGNAVKYDDADKGTITLAGAEGTTITHVKAGTLSAESTDAVNGSQLFDTNTKLAQEIQDRKDAITKEVSDRDTAIGAAKKEITDKIGTIDANGSYITADGTISSNLTALDTQVKNNQSAIEKEVQDRKDAITGVETKITTLTGNAVQYDDATKGKVTLGGGDTGTTIGNVKAGTLSADSKEAVNGSQLFTTNSNLTQEIADRTAADEAEKTARENADNDIKNNIIGTVADGTYIKASGTIADNLGKLDAGVKANADSITDVRDNVIGTITDGTYIKASDNVAGSLGKLDAGVKANADAIIKEVTDRTNEITKAKEELNTKISTLDGNAVKYDDADKDTITLAGAEGTTITHVKAGTLSAESTDAVNGSQLFDTNTKLAQEIQDRKDAITKEVSDRDTAIGAAKKEITDKIGTIDANGSYITADGTISSNLTALDTQVKNNQSAIEKEVQDRKDAITGVETKITTLTGNAVQYDDETKGKVTLGGGENGTTIGNVKAGTLSADSKEAVNGSQLFTTNSNLTQEIADRTEAINDVKDNVIGTITDGTYVKAAENVAGNLGKLDAGVKANADAITKEVQDRKDAITKEIKDRDDAIGAAKTEITNQINTLSGNAVQYDDATKGKVTLGGGDTGTTIANLKAGTLSADSMEAVNGSQLFESNRQIALNKSSISDLSRSVDSMRSSITSNSKRIDALSKTVTEVNSNVSTTISDMASLQKNNANLDLSNLSDEGNATITQIAKNAVQSYLQSASTDAKNNASATQTMEARFASPVATFAVGSAITYDDETNSKITLGTDGSTVDILGVKGGQVYEGSTHAATGDDVFKVQKQVNGFSGTLDTINAGMSKINASLASNLKDITALQTTTATTKQKVDRGYTLDINGITAKNVTPTDNSINFKSGTNVTISNNGGSIEFAVEGNGDIAEGNTGLISGGTAFTALAEKADKDLSNLTDEAKKNIQNAMGGDMSSKANIDLDNLSEAGIAKIKSTMASDLAGKAATDASNIDAGKYAEKLGTGVVTDGDDNLVTGSTVYNAIKDLQGGTGGLITKMDVNMKNISKEGKTTIKNLSKEAVKLADGKYTTVSSEEDSEGNLTYKVNVTADGSIEDGNTGLITGDTAKKALDKKANTDLDNISDAGKNVIKDAVKDDLAKKANTDLSNLTEEGKNQIKNAVSADLETKANLDASNIGGHVSDWARVLGTGKVEKGNANLVTGDQVFSAVSVKADKTYVDEELSKKANTTDVNKALDGKANSDLSNITDAGKTVIKDTMKADMDKKADKSYVDNALASKVDKSDFDAVKDQVNQNKADLANKADKSYVDKELGKKADADNVYTKDETDKKIDSKLETVKDTLAGDLNNKVNKDGSNMDKDAWQEKLGDGKDEAGNKGLITGDTLNKALNDVRKDGTGLVRQEGDTIQIAPKADATKVDIKGMDKDGNSIDRVLTGVKTDENDASSAANVGYVQGIQSDLESQMDYMNNRLSNDIKEAGAVASALAGLHHIDYDPDNKLDFAVATAGYRGKSAAALGAFYQPNENIMFSLAGTIGSNHNAWNMGLSFKIGSGSDSPVLSRRVLGNQVQILAKQNQLLAENNEKLQQDVEDLKAKLDRLLASATLSPDVEKSIAK